MKATKKDWHKVIKTVLIIVTTLAAVGVFLFIRYGNRIAGSMHSEVFKLTYQFLTFAVLGGGMSVLFSHYERKREDKLKLKEKKEVEEKERKEKKEVAEKEVRALQKKFYNEFVQTYKETKKIRRLLRARTRKLVDSSVMIKTSEYDLLMKELTVIQLKCEFLRDEVKCSPELFGLDEINPGEAKNAQTPPLEHHLTVIETYLNKLVSEYEKRFADFPGKHYLSEVEFLSLDSLEKLKEFMEPYADSKTYKDFKNSVEAVLTILLQKMAMVGS